MRAPTVTITSKRRVERVANQCLLCVYIPLIVVKVGGKACNKSEDDGHHGWQDYSKMCGIFQECHQTLSGQQSHIR